jgi:hypothetical protein
MRERAERERERGRETERERARERDRETERESKREQEREREREQRESRERERAREKVGRVLRVGNILIILHHENNQCRLSTGRSFELHCWWWWLSILSRPHLSRGDSSSPLRAERPGSCVRCCFGSEHTHSLMAVLPL